MCAPAGSLSGQSPGMGLGCVKTPWWKHRRAGISGEVAMRGQLSGFGVSFHLEVLLMLIPAVFGGSAAALGLKADIASSMPAGPWSAGNVPNGRLHSLFKPETPP